MSVQSDKWIIKMAKEQAMISPFEDKQIREGKISFGVSSYGYDARVSNEFKIFTNVNSEIVDPKNFKPTNFVTKESDECIIPPNSFVLARTVEYFKIPSDVLVICLGINLKLVVPLRSEERYQFLEVKMLPYQYSLQLYSLIKM